MQTADGPGPRARPKQERSQQTYELLLNVAGTLLAEVGIDRISTNMICARAGMTPPALYRYFDDKYAVLEALGHRLMARQNEALEQWLARYEPGGIESLRGNMEELLRNTAAITASEPGAVWILRALHASPRLIHVRVESHRYVTNRLTDAYARHLPHMSREQLWRRLRVLVEVGFAIDEMLQEEDRVDPDMAFRNVVRMLQVDLSD